MKELVTFLNETKHVRNPKDINATLEFSSGYLPEQIDDIPEKSGIYVAYACKDLGDRYLCKRILYIGKAEGPKDSIRGRVSDHVYDRDKSESGKQSFWEKNYCDDGEIVVYSYALYEKNLHDIEAVLIFRNECAANIHNNRTVCNADAWHVVVSCKGQVGLLHHENIFWKLLRGTK